MIIKDEEDILQEGFIALWNGLQHYDASKNDNIATFLFPCVKHAMYRYVNTCRRMLTNSCSLEQLIDDGEVALPSIIHEYSDTDISTILTTYHKWLKKHHKGQTGIQTRLYRTRLILEELIKGYSQKEVSNNLNIHRTTVNELLREVRESLKNEYPSKYKYSKRRTNKDG